MSRSVDIAYVGAQIDAFNAAGAGPDIPVVGYRIIPVLPAGATQADLLAAYNALTVRVTKQSTKFPGGVQESQYIAGPDWQAGVGIGRIEIMSGLNPTTYRVWLATDCKEMEFVETPVMNGFAGAGASPGGGTNVATSENQNLTAAAPTAAGDGVVITGARAVRLSYKAANAGATMNAVGRSNGYWYSSTLARWVRCPELDIDWAAMGAAPVEPAGAGPAPFTLAFNASATRVQWVATGMTVSAGTQVVRSIEVQT